MDLPKILREKYDITSLPLHVHLGEKSFEDGINITNEDIFSFYEKNKMLPKTSAVSVAEYESFFKKCVDEGSEVVHICMSLELSSTYQNAVIAAQGLDGVYVIDSRSLSGGMGFMVLRAAKLCNDGKTAEEIFNDLMIFKNKIYVSFILYNLEFMQKGGRCSATTALSANLLGIRPSIIMKDGKLILGKKYRGKYDSCCLQYVDDILKNAGNADLSYAMVFNTGGIPQESLEQITKKVLDFGFKEVLTGNAGSVITSHCGKGTVGLFFAEK